MKGVPKFTIIAILTDEHPACLNTPSQGDFTTSKATCSTFEKFLILRIQSLYPTQISFIIFALSSQSNSIQFSPVFYKRAIKIPEPIVKLSHSLLIFWLNKLRASRCSFFPLPDLFQFTNVLSNMQCSNMDTIFQVWSGLVSAEQRGTMASLDLNSVLLLIQSRIAFTFFSPCSYFILLVHIQLMIYQDTQIPLYILLPSMVSILLQHCFFQNFAFAAIKINIPYFG